MAQGLDCMRKKQRDLTCNQIAEGQRGLGRIVVVWLVKLVSYCFAHRLDGAFLFRLQVRRLALCASNAKQTLGRQLCAWACENRKHKHHRHSLELWPSMVYSIPYSEFASAISSSLLSLGTAA